MSNLPAEITETTLQAFAEAWNRHDIDALMSFMTEDCVFESSAGPAVCGTRYAGDEAVRAGYIDVWVTFPDAHWGNAVHFVCGDRGFPREINAQFKSSSCTIVARYLANYRSMS